MATYFTNRDYRQIADELFFGSRAAIKKYRLARHAQYEIDLLNEYKRPFEEAYFVYSNFFHLAFLAKAKGQTKEERWQDACERLSEAVGESGNKNRSCLNRCVRLMKELNLYMPDEERMTFDEIMALIDWLTFDFTYIEEEGSGFIKRNEEYGYPLIKWYDEDNLNEFKAKLREHIKAGEEIPYQQIWVEVIEDRYRKNPDIDIEEFSFLG